MTSSLRAGSLLGLFVHPLCFSLCPTHGSNSTSLLKELISFQRNGIVLKSWDREPWLYHILYKRRHSVRCNVSPTPTYFTKACMLSPGLMCKLILLCWQYYILLLSHTVLPGRCFFAFLSEKGTLGNILSELEDWNHFHLRNFRSIKKDVMFTSRVHLEMLGGTPNSPGTG